MRKYTFRIDKFEYICTSLFLSFVSFRMGFISILFYYPHRSNLQKHTNEFKSMLPASIKSCHMRRILQHCTHLLIHRYSHT